MNVKVLNVAEKNSVARELCNQLTGNGQHSVRRGTGNGIFVADFPLQLNNVHAAMTVTAVRGHLTEIDFEPAECKNWGSYDPAQLFHCPIKTAVAHADIATNLRKLAREADWLILWLDCDREGEAIAFEVLDVCVKAKRSLKIFRARFSALTRQDLMHALMSLGPPNRLLAEAVRARTEIDLRVGVAFTRFLTLRFQPRGEQRRLISFGACQTSTLGFVVARWLGRQQFVPENFWSIKLTALKDNPGSSSPTVIQLAWDRGRVFDLPIVEAIHSCLQDSRTAQVIEWKEQPKTRRRPLPMNTLELAKISATHLRIPSHQCMQLAESLYTKGLISYPRTETEVFHESMDLKAIVAIQANHSDWGSFAQRLVSSADPLYVGPRQGSKDDQAHPPIHPLKCAERYSFDNNDEYRVYELVCRHFLACLAKDGQGSSSHVTVELVSEKFHAEGLCVTELNWLLVYPYAKWTSTAVLPVMHVGEQLRVQSLSISQGTTEAPTAITEAELLAIMDKEGIGTDATMHEHIRTIQDRGYCFLDNQRFFIPTNVGIALVIGLGAYEPLGFHLAKPTLRANMERDMGLISQGQLSREEFIARYARRMREIFVAITDNPSPLDVAIRPALQAAGPPPVPSSRNNNNGRPASAGTARPKRNASSRRTANRRPDGVQRPISRRRRQ
jgi:DNA topoisomerase-3